MATTGSTDKVKLELEAAELVGSIKSSENRLQWIKRRESEIETELKELRKERDLLVGYWSNTGEITSLKRKLEVVNRTIADLSLPEVVWEGIKSRDTYVVEKVTPKRIVIRERGKEYRSQYNHDGTAVGYSQCNIDIAATFPDGLKLTKSK